MVSKTKVAVALSGGIDSSVSAFLMLDKGYDVVAITAKMVDDEHSEVVILDAKKVADKLGIEHYVVDLSGEFKNKVIDYFESSYQNAETPNPCVKCNKYIKWGAILDYALNQLGVDYIATGHYARVEKEDGNILLYPPVDKKKDQLYYLFELTQEQLSKTIFPLDRLTKEQVRVIAEENDLPSKSQKESQDICFIQKPMTTKEYLHENLDVCDGDFVFYRTGEVLGQHSGFCQYTVGQRKGIGISYSEPLYVVKIDSCKNIVYLGIEDDLRRRSIMLENVNWHDNTHEMPFEALVKIRYHMEPRKALLIPVDDLIKVIFYEDVFAPAKGQAAVFYHLHDGHLLGGGWIAS